MKRWEVKRIDALGKVVTGKTPSSDHPDEFGAEYPFITPSDIPETKKHVAVERFLSEKGMESHKNIQLPAKTTCVVCIGATIGKTCMTKGPSFTNQQINSIIANKDNDADFIYYLATTLKDALISFSGGAATPIVNKSIFSAIKVSTPPKETQRKAAAILSAYDDLIESNNRRITILEKMAEELYREWFVRLRFPGHEKVKIVKRVPEGWEIKRIDDFFEYLEGPGIRNWQYTDSGVPFINIRLIDKGDINISKASYISETEAYGKYTHFLLKENDFVLSTSGSIGRGAVVLKHHLPLLLNTSVIRFRPKDKKSFSYMYEFLRSDSFLSNVEILANGSAQLNFGPTHLKGMRFICPPSHVISSFNELANPIHNQLAKLRIANMKLAIFRNCLLSRLMSGKIDVENMDIEFPASMKEELVHA